MAWLLYIKNVFQSLSRRANATYIINFIPCAITWVKYKDYMVLKSNHSILPCLQHMRRPHRCVEGPHPVCKTKAPSIKTEDGIVNVVAFTVTSQYLRPKHQDKGQIQTCFALSSYLTRCELSYHLSHDCSSVK